LKRAAEEGGRRVWPRRAAERVKTGRSARR
jgi:hypothetical protein